ncbi:hypothetical protein YC2023_100132 [Brassica napus]
MRSLGLVLLECALGKFPYTPPGHMKGWTKLVDIIEHKFVNMFEDSDANLSSYFTNAGSLIPPLAIS